MPTAATPERDMLGYSGRRCVVAGAGTAFGRALVGLLVASGAEVHAIDGDPDNVATAGLASRTAADPTDGAQLHAAAARIGAVVEAAFDCSMATPHTPMEAPTISPVLDALLPLMVANGAAVSVVMTASDGFVPGSDFDDARRPVDMAPTRDAATDAPDGVRVHTVRCDAVDTDDGDAGDRLEALAWLTMLVASPRAGALTTPVIRARA